MDHPIPQDRLLESHFRLNGRVCRFKHPITRDQENPMIQKKLTSGQYRLYSRKKDPKTGKRHNLGTFETQSSRISRAGGAVFQASRVRFILRRVPGAPSLRGLLRKGGIPQSPLSRDFLDPHDRRSGNVSPVPTFSVRNGRVATSFAPL
jgi:hypothetical protein